MKHSFKYVPLAQIVKYEIFRKFYNVIMQYTNTAVQGYNSTESSNKRLLLYSIYLESTSNENLCLISVFTVALLQDTK